MRRTMQSEPRNRLHELEKQVAAQREAIDAICLFLDAAFDEETRQKIRQEISRRALVANWAGKKMRLNAE